MSSVKFFVVTLCLLVALTQGLNCLSGFELYRGKSGNSIFKEWNETECSTTVPHACMRGKGNFMASTVNFTVFSAGCVEEALCQEKCGTLLIDSITPKDGDMSPFSHNGTNVFTCELVCCKTDFCNNNTIEEISALNAMRDNGGSENLGMKKKLLLLITSIPIFIHRLFQ